MIEYSINNLPTTAEVIELYRLSGLPRPIDDAERIASMYAGSNLIATARQGGKLVGVARTITDHVWSAYLADLAVDPSIQRAGIGKRLVEITREALGEQSMLLLLSVPDAMEYYPKIGMETVTNGFIFQRKR